MSPAGWAAVVVAVLGVLGMMLAYHLGIERGKDVLREDLEHRSRRIERLARNSRGA